jgi:ADP-ribose pyrophosphatase YjhB (NUDIX family)
MEQHPNIMDNRRFAEAFSRLAEVQLNPRRHTAPSALAHSEAVAAKAVALARANGCSEREIRLLENLGRAHDIGKITGTARPERSLEVLGECGVAESELLALVKWHDTSLPWYQSSTKGQQPSEKAWRRLASEVDVRLLCLFMVADRVDAPPGWRRNPPTHWFLGQARARGLIGELTLDLPGEPSEVSAGGAVVRASETGPAVLVIRVRTDAYELPKGGLEWDELAVEAALRETREETGIETRLRVDGDLGSVDYVIGETGEQHVKRAHYFRLSSEEPLAFGPLPKGTRERRWIPVEEASSLRLVNNDLRSVLLAAFERQDVGT